MRDYTLNKKPIYAVYDEDDLPIATGTIKELSDFLGLTVSCLYDAANRKSLIKAKYRIYFIGNEEITEKKCAICGRVKPIEQFATRIRNGKRVYINHCKLCHSIYNKKSKESRKMKKK